jgi:hypothetical protein
MKKHTLWMVLGCGIPLLFVFLAPTLGINGGSSLFIFITLMFAIHLFMPMHHHDKHNNEDSNQTKDKKDHHH